MGTLLGTQTNLRANAFSTLACHDPGMKQPDREFLEHTEKLAVESAAAVAAVALIAIAAATQVWDYPGPRIAFGRLGLALIGTAIFFYAANLTAGQAQSCLRSGAKGGRFFAVASVVFMHAAALITLVVLFHFLWTEGGTCLLGDNPVCLQKAPLPN